MRPRLPRTARRLARPAIAVVLVCAQAVAAFGFPVVRTRAGGQAGACGGGQCVCETACGGMADGCCCRPARVRTTAPVPAPPAAVEEACESCGEAVGACYCAPAEPVTASPACPKCAAPPPAAERSTPRVTWVAAWTARQCRGEGPLWFLGEAPAVVPADRARPIGEPVPTGVIPLADCVPVSHVSVPLDPPPRCG